MVTLVIFPGCSHSLSAPFTVQVSAWLLLLPLTATCARESLRVCINALARKRGYPKLNGDSQRTQIPVQGILDDERHLSVSGSSDFTIVYELVDVVTAAAEVIHCLTHGEPYLVHLLYYAYRLTHCLEKKKPP